MQVVLVFMILIDGFIKLIHLAIRLILISTFDNDQAGLFKLATFGPSA
jgi:hypothetical protein